MPVEYKPRLCHVVRGADGYGFHLHGEKGKLGQRIRKVEVDSPADIANLKEGDKIIAVNGKNVEKEEHHEVVARIKERSGETTLLVVDEEADKYFKDNNIPITEELLIQVTTETDDDKQGSSTEIETAIQSSTSAELRPRLCHLERGSSGYGFNLHSEKGKQGSFIKSVEPDGPSEVAGLKSGDRIVEINGKNLEYEKHNAIVAAIKGSGNEVDMLVVDEQTDKFFKELNVVPTADHVSGPLPTRQENSVPEVVKPEAPPAPSSPTTNGASLPEMDLAMLKEKSRSSRKKAAPQSNWNNRQAIFNNL